MRAKLIAGILVPTLVVGGGVAYAFADAADRVPGWITNEPLPVAPANFPPPAIAQTAPVLGDPVEAFDPSAPMPNAAVLAALAQTLRDDPRTGRSTGVSVVDIATGQVLVDLEASDPQVPASTAKLMVATAALAALGPDYRLTTSVTVAGTAVTLVGGGDMMLAAGNGHGGAGSDANGYAGLGDLADATAAHLTASGITTVRVLVDDSLFEGPAVIPTWPWYVVSYGYGTPVTGLAVNIGRLTEDKYPPRQADPSLSAGQAFAAALEAHGIAVTTVAHGVGGGEVVATVESAPLAQILQFLLVHSDNTIAEVISQIVSVNAGGRGTPAAGAAAVTAQLTALGLDTTGLVLRDGSGFASTARISPQNFTDAIQLLAANPDYDDLLAVLPLAALEGTLDDRYVDTPAAGVVRAKTGSLTGVTSLAGTVVTADGRWLAFAVLADGMPSGQDRPRAAIDEFVAALAACGCQE